MQSSSILEQGTYVAVVYASYYVWLWPRRRRSVTVQSPLYSGEAHVGSSNSLVKKRMRVRTSPSDYITGHYRLMLITCWKRNGCILVRVQCGPPLEVTHVGYGTMTVNYRRSRFGSSILSASTLALVCRLATNEEKANLDTCRFKSCQGHL